MGAVRAALVAIATWGVVGCERHDRAPSFTPPDSSGAYPDGGVRIDPSTSEQPPNCGGKTLNAVVHYPVLYFAVDRSGSMLDPVDETGTTKYEAARNAIGSVLDLVGARVRFGAAVFPGTDEPGSCVPGSQVFAPVLGDLPRADGQRGPILSNLLQVLRKMQPGGATPTASTLRALAPTLRALKESASVVLLTDGAPNCDSGIRCDSASCIPDIEQATLNGKTCGKDLSCCDPAKLGAGAGGNCIDADQTESSVRALSAAGIVTYVVGMPGSEAYASLLARLAVAGGSARPSETVYYAVSDSDALGEALYEIGTGVSIDCDISLDGAPPDRDLVNVYFDREVVVRDAESGWDYSGDTGLSLRGAACADLQSGRVRQVRIAYGCQTVVR